MSGGKHFSNGKRTATHTNAPERRGGSGREFDARKSGYSAATSTSHAEWQAAPTSTPNPVPKTVPNTTDPFAPDYQDPALSSRQRRRAEKQRSREAARSEDGGRGWTFLYVLAALVITVLVWLLLGGGV